MMNVEQINAPLMMRMTDLKKGKANQDIQQAIQLSLVGLTVWQTSFLSYLEATLKDKYCFSMFLDLKTLACFSVASRATYHKCNDLWLAFANPEIFNYISIESFLPKWMGNDLIKDSETMLVHCVNKNYCSINLFNILHASNPQLVKKGFLKAAAAGNLNALDAYMNYYKVNITQVQDKSGNTVLIKAAKNGKHAVIKKLLDHLKEQNLETTEIQNFIKTRNFNGYSALSIARRNLKYNESVSPDCYYRTFHNTLKSVELLASMSSLSTRMAWKLYTPSLVCMNTVCCCGMGNAWECSSGCTPLIIYDEFPRWPASGKICTLCCIPLCIPFCLVYAVPVSCCVLQCDSVCDKYCEF